MKSLILAVLLSTSLVSIAKADCTNAQLYTLAKKKLATPSVVTELNKEVADHGKWTWKSTGIAPTQKQLKNGKIRWTVDMSSGDEDLQVYIVTNESCESPKVYADLSTLDDG